MAASDGVTSPFPPPCWAGLSRVRLRVVACVVPKHVLLTLFTGLASNLYTAFRLRFRSCCCSRLPSALSLFRNYQSCLMLWCNGFFGSLCHSCSKYIGFCSFRKVLWLTIRACAEGSNFNAKAKYFHLVL